MNQSKYKRWRVLLHRMIAKQGKIEQIYPVFTRSGTVWKIGER